MLQACKYGSRSHSTLSVLQLPQEVDEEEPLELPPELVARKGVGEGQAGRTGADRTVEPWTGKANRVMLAKGKGCVRLGEVWS